MTQKRGGWPRAEVLRVGGNNYFDRAGGECDWRLLILPLYSLVSFPRKSSQPPQPRPFSLPSSSLPPHQPTMSIHGNLSKRPPLDGTVHIDTQELSTQPSSNNNDVTGVLRRNQACLQCRRRKLACCLLL